LRQEGAVASGADFLRALRVQLRVIGALYRWEVIQRYGRDNLGFLWLFLEPIIFTLAVTALWAAVGAAKESRLPVVAFALTGYASVLLWRNCATRCTLAIQAYMGLLYHRPIRVIDVLLTKVLLEVAGATLSFVALGFLWVSIGWAEPPERLDLVLAGWFMLIWFSTALALTVGALTSLNEIVERLWHPTAYILFPLSGAIFMVDWLAGDFQRFVLWLPMVHCTELIREGFFGSQVHSHYDMTYVAGVSLVGSVLALALVRVASRQLEFR
jgi:ABC-type polysaccharide/polyol phosphate export permease